MPARYAGQFRVFVYQKGILLHGGSGNPGGIHIFLEGHC